MNKSCVAMTYQQIIEGLETLSPNDFTSDESNGLQKLRLLTNELLQQPNPERAIPALFAVMERMPDAELGSPGPLVHTIEAIKNYESELKASVHRAPCPLSVWMVNRVLNATRNSEQREGWLSLLDSVATNSTASPATKREAFRFINLQKGRSR